MSDTPKTDNIVFMPDLMLDHIRWLYARLDHLLTVADEGYLEDPGVFGPNETFDLLRKELPKFREIYGFEKTWPHTRTPSTPLEKPI